MKHWVKMGASLVGAALLATGVAATAQTPANGAAATAYAPTVDDWVGVNAAVDNYSLGLDLHDMARFDKAFWPEAKIIAQPEPGLSFAMPYRMAAEGPKGPPPGGIPGGPPPGAAPGGPPPGAPSGPPPGGNAIGSNIAPWHLSLSHHFEFQSATHATHYGLFISVYPDLKTKVTTVGLPGHYEDILEKRKGEWRILERKTVIGAK
ncbi:hypothetical protein [Novosphingobium sp.]|uniref:hypothetical protein n=1 Tax=Novosphingobium sp. TaxID=1874826 RepID=UPI0038BDCAD4